MVLQAAPAREPSPELGLRSLDRGRKQECGTAALEISQHRRRLSLVHHHFNAFSFPGEQNLRYPSRVRDREGRRETGEEGGCSGTEQEPRAEGTWDRLPAPSRPLGGEALPHLPTCRLPPFASGEGGAGGKGTGRGGSPRSATARNKGPFDKPSRRAQQRGLETARTGAAAGEEGKSGGGRGLQARPERLPEQGGAGGLIPAHKERRRQSPRGARSGPER